MSRSISRARWTRRARWAAVPVAVIASGAIISTASYSAFSATTSHPTSNWSTGTVQLTDDDSDVALFSASNLMPGDAGTKCVTVTSTGSLPSAVRLYGTAATTTNSLSSYLDLTIQQGSGASSASCDGFTPASQGAQVFSGTLADFASQRTGYANGAPTWSPTGTTAEARSFKFSYSLSQSTPNTGQDSRAAIAFTWEAQTR
jgi:Tfp pilus assembly protein PilW